MVIFGQSAENRSRARDTQPIRSVSAGKGVQEYLRSAFFEKFEFIQGDRRVTKQMIEYFMSREKVRDTTYGFNRMGQLPVL